ncbi:MAG: aldehyde dehydrogenase family protein, partial [Actinobacteria bacterium]|nr:aldehyde dehydrogenase family protein [Actinomycetota bacterium]
MTLITHWIAGAAVDSTGAGTQDVYNPATGEVIAQVALGSSGDVDAAVASGLAAFEEWSQVSLAKRTA